MVMSAMEFTFRLIFLKIRSKGPDMSGRGIRYRACEKRSPPASLCRRWPQGWSMPGPKYFG